MYRNRETKLPLKANPEVRGTKAMTNGDNKSTKKHQKATPVILSYDHCADDFAK